MYVQLELINLEVKGHVPNVTLYVVILLKGHISPYSEWTILDSLVLTNY